MKYITSIWTSIALIVLLTIVRISDPHLIEQIRLNTFDLYIKTIPEQKSDDIVIVDIGEKSLGLYGQFPWPRQEYAQMIDTLRKANAGLIIFTM